MLKSFNLYMNTVNKRIERTIFIEFIFSEAFQVWFKKRELLFKIQRAFKSGSNSNFWKRENDYNKACYQTGYLYLLPFIWKGTNLASRCWQHWTENIHCQTNMSQKVSSHRNAARYEFLRIASRNSSFWKTNVPISGSSTKSAKSQKLKILFSTDFTRMYSNTSLYY